MLLNGSGATRNVISISIHSTCDSFSQVARTDLTNSSTRASISGFPRRGETVVSRGTGVRRLADFSGETFRQHNLPFREAWYIRRSSLLRVIQISLAILKRSPIRSCRRVGTSSARSITKFSKGVTTRSSELERDFLCEGMDGMLRQQGNWEFEPSRLNTLLRVLFPRIEC